MPTPPCLELQHSAGENKGEAIETIETIETIEAINIIAAIGLTTAAGAEF